MSTDKRYTYDDMILAFETWKNMEREGVYFVPEIVELAWRDYAKIRDAIQYRPFPQGAILASGRRKKEVTVLF